MVFINLERTCDRVMWWALEKKQIPCKYIINDMHDVTLRTVRR